MCGRRIVGEATRAAMREVLEEIRAGTFARRWIREAESGGGEFKRMRELDRAHPIEAVGAALRARMTWLQEA